MFYIVWKCSFELVHLVAPVAPADLPSSLSPSFRPERPSNVVGQPKGRGQTTETFLDRRKKEANKSRVSNHNRRSMADRKRNKGMIPSWPAWWLLQPDWWREEGVSRGSEGFSSGLKVRKLVPHLSPQSHISPRVAAFARKESQWRFSVVGERSL